MSVLADLRRLASQFSDPSYAANYNDMLLQLTEAARRRQFEIVYTPTRITAQQFVEYLLQRSDMAGMGVCLIEESSGYETRGGTWVPEKKTKVAISWTATAPDSL